MRVRLRKKKLTESLTAALFVFSDVLMNPNLNLLYMLGAFLFLEMLIRQRKSLKEWALIYLPLLLIPFFHRFFYSEEVDELKVIVYLFKMAINISLMIWIKNNLCILNLNSIYTSAYHQVTLLFVVALIFRTELLWRLNDTINSFSKVRLQLLYSEPSVLGLFCCVMLLLLCFSILTDKLNLRRATCLGILLIILVLTFSLSGILYFAIGLITMVTLFYGQGVIRKGKIAIRLLIFSLVGIVAIFMVLMTENPVSARIFAILGGQDGSFAYRWVYSSASIGRIMERTHYMGMGMGNMNTNHGLLMMIESGISGKYSNSFLYFIGENGILGLFFIVFILGYCIRCITYSKQCGHFTNISYLKIALFVSITIEQVFGGYFTDPFIWCVYGVICSSNIDERKCSIL